MCMYTCIYACPVHVHVYLSSHDQSTKVHMYLMDILIGIVQEGEHLSTAIIDTILINILEPQKVS